MADCMRLFDRYSNTLLVSLNNRISIRDAYGARGGDVDRQVVTGPSNSAREEAITETNVSETDRLQDDLMGHPATEGEVKESK
jgi:hypothetical protein